ncbi:MAG: hypothetical protein JXB88_12720 [Spirochaetales bacterium]|nr:hypothetical protein [Spirochaetales bacterium]
MKKNILVRILLPVILFCITIVIPVSLAGETMAAILPPEQGISPVSLTFFSGSTGNLHIGFESRKEDGPAAIASVRAKGNAWLAPDYLESPGGNEVVLHGIKNLSDGSPLLLLSGDDTDYSVLFTLTASELGTGSDISDYFPDIPPEQFTEMLEQHQRLYFSIQSVTGWSSPVPIPGTYGVTRAFFETGKNNSALLVFFKDEKSETEPGINRELYYSVFNGITWGYPVRLTDNAFVEYGVEVTSLPAGIFLVTWLIDNDNNDTTENDKLIYAAAIDKSGIILNTPGPVTHDFQENPQAVTGRYGDKGIILWTSGTDDGAGGQKPVWQSVYEYSWSEPEKTGLNVIRMPDAHLYSVDDELLFLYRNGNMIAGACNINGIWRYSGEIINLNAIDLTMQDMDFFCDGQQIFHLAVSGFVPGKGEGDEAAGIYYTAFSLLPDIAVEYVDVFPEVLSLQQTVTCGFRIINTGFFPAYRFSTCLSINGTATAPQEVDGLLPGESVVLEHPVTISKPKVFLDHRIEASFPERNCENNITTHTLKILPDYKVDSVVRSDEKTICARIVEMKRIAALPVQVDFYSVTGDHTDALGTTVFDPNSDIHVFFTWEQMEEIYEPFQVVVAVNQDRAVKEDDYSNNKGSYIFEPLPDFCIENLAVTGNHISLSLVNKGADYNGTVEVLVTDNPEIAALLPDAEPGVIHIEESITCTGSKKTDVVLYDEGIAALHNKRLYAMVNPSKATGEVNYNNNTETAGIFGNTTPPAGAGCKLTLGKVYFRGQDIVAPIINLGSTPGIVPVVELYKDSLLLARKTVPVVKPFRWDTVTFPHVSAGDYRVKLTYQVSENQYNSCQATVSR